MEANPTTAIPVSTQQLVYQVTAQAAAELRNGLLSIPVTTTPNWTDAENLVGLQTLDLRPGPWAPELEGLLFGGMPKVNETVWFHPASGTLILTDICQNWTGPLAWQARWWAKLSGVHMHFDVPLIVRLLTRDRLAAKASAQEVLRWPIERVLLGHNTPIEANAKAQLTRAFQFFQ